MAKKFYRQGWLMSHLRRLSVKYPPRLEVLNEAKTTYYIKSKIGTDVKRVSFQCSVCKTKDLKSKEIQMDHIKPVGSFINWETYIERLFCEKSNFQAICLNCHSKKTLNEEKDKYFKKKKK